jgi:CheY-like chemotaxis protein
MFNTKILIVEDDKTSAYAFQQIILKIGYKYCSIVYSGEEALLYVTENPVDIVFMDIALGQGINGISTAIRLRNILNIPSIFATMSYDRETIEECKKAHPVGYVIKPYNINQIVATLEIALNVVKMEKEIRTLSGLIPICSKCKQVRNDQGYWQQVEAYIEERTPIMFTQDVCPECAKKLYKDLK